MLRIFLTGDNHIGLKYANHDKASVLAEARITAFENMVQTANAESCDIFVISGDLFDRTYGISKKTMQSLADILSAFNGTVVVLPGNHDYYDKDVKVWQDFGDAVKSKDNIMLLTEYRPYFVSVNGEEAVLYPAFCTSKHSEPDENNLGWIKKESVSPDSTYRIGIAHGSVEGETIDSEGRYFPMERSELESIPVDVWLIGHTHVMFPNYLKEDYINCSDRIFNAGAHVQTDVACNTEGCCFIIEIDEDKSVKAKKVVSGNIRFYRKNIRFAAGEMENILGRELAAIEDNSVVDLILSGAVTQEEYDNRVTILDDALSRFIEGTYNDTDLSRLITKEVIESEFPETSFSAGLMTALLSKPKEVQLVYELIKSLKEGK